MADPRFFNRNGPFTLDVIVRQTGASIHGNHDGSRLFRDVAGLDHAESCDLGFLDNSRYVEVFERSRAGACFVNTKFKDRAPDGMVPIVCEDPYLAFALAARMFHPEPAAIPGVSDKALVDPDSHVGEDASIGAFAVISAGVEIGARCSIGAGAVLCDNIKIGNDCHIGPGVTLMYCVIGDRVWIDAGARVGTQGFGFARSPTGAVRIPHVGLVLIGDDVEIGANTTIDRGSVSDTIIESGTMIDNQVQIAHNVKIGRHAILAGQAGLAGSAVIGDFAMLGGRTSVANHVRVGRGARMGGSSSAASDLAEGETYLGTPAIPIREFWRHHATIRRLSRRGQHVMNEETFGDAPKSARGYVIDIERVMQLIPHRYPFLMIDRVVDVVRNESAIGIKNVSINEPQFQGHFDRHPVMPGVYIIEAMAQSAAVLVVETLGKAFEGKLVYFMGVDKARFRKPVTPGDVMKVHVRKEQRRGMVWKFSSVVKVDDATVAEAGFSAMILDN